VHQAQIMALLTEASSLGIEARKKRSRPRWRIPDDHPVEVIRKKFAAACEKFDDETKNAHTRKMANTIFTDTVIYHPENLPALFPFFSLACSDKQAGMHWQYIDWYQMGMPHHWTGNVA